MKQGSAFPYISYAVARRTRIVFSLMTHCICHERGTRFNAVPGSTPNNVLASTTRYSPNVIWGIRVQTVDQESFIKKNLTSVLMGGRDKPRAGWKDV
jgi:hypothetical protein